MMTSWCYSNILLSIEDALNNIYDEINVLTDDEIVNLESAFGRVLSEHCFAPFDLPAFENSSMDGYAFNSADIQQTGFALRQIGTPWAGRPFNGKVTRRQCVRIFTGAVLPEDTDSVIMQEEIEVENNFIHYSADTKARKNVRHIGEDVHQQSCLIATPKQLTAIDLGLLASAGVDNVRVKRKIRIAFFPQVMNCALLEKL